MTSTSCVYLIECAATRKKYIGSTGNARRRFAAHLKSLQKGSHPTRPMQADFDTHGEGTFTFVILESASTRQKAMAKERQVIAGMSPQCLYNERYKAHVPQAVAFPLTPDDINGGKIVHTAYKLFGSLQAISDATGVSVATLSRWRKGSTRPHLGTMLLLMTAIDKKREGKK